LGVCTFQGCQHYCQRPAFSIPAVPCGPCGAAPASLAVPQAVLQPPSAVVPADTRRYEPPLAAPNWRPSTDGGVRLKEPELAPTQPPPPAALPKPPDTGDRGPTPSLPVGIAQFALAKDQVASGLRPDLDGVKWLQENGYRTVLHIRRPAEDDTADRRLFEQRGLRFLSLEASPQTLTRKLTDEFDSIVTDVANRPLFVYDKDGVLVGGLWYLHFRKAERAGDDEARAKAARLGLKTEQDGEQKAMWLAIQKYLSEQAK